MLDVVLTLGGQLWRDVLSPVVTALEAIAEPGLTSLEPLQAHLCFKTSSMDLASTDASTFTRTAAWR